MKKDQIQKYSFMALLLIIGIIVFFIFSPFLMVFALSGIFTIALYSLYQKFFILFKSRGRLAALLVLLIVTVGIITPTLFLGVQIFNQTQDLYFQLRENQSEYLSKVTQIVEPTIQKFNPAFTLDLQNYARTFVDWVLTHVRGFVSGTFSVFLNAVLIILVMFFLLKDGERLKKTLIRISPLGPGQSEEIATIFGKTIKSVVLGALSIAIIQGLLAGIGFAFFGVPNAVLWGSLTAVTALIPSAGTAIVIFPVAAYLYLTSSLGASIGLLVWGVLVVGLIDNLLRPYFYGRSVEVHPLLVLFSVFGGLALFGPAGIIFGPVILMLFHSLLSMYEKSKDSDTH